MPYGGLILYGSMTKARRFFLYYKSAYKKMMFYIMAAVCDILWNSMESQIEEGWRLMEGQFVGKRTNCASKK